MSAEPRQTSAPELKAQIEAERGGRPFLVFRDGEGEQRIVLVEEGTTELWVGRGELGRPAARLGRGGLRPARPDRGRRATSARCSTTASPATAPSSARSGSTGGGACATATRCASAAPRSSSAAPARARPKRPSAASEVPAAATVSPASAASSSPSAAPSRTATPSPRRPTNQAIADELHLSVDAVKTHMRALFEKLGVEDLPQNRKRVALAERALQSGVVSRREL